MTQLTGYMMFVNDTPFNIASAVILITAQRLAPRLCPNCKAPQDIPHETLTVDRIRSASGRVGASST